MTDAAAPLEKKTVVRVRVWDLPTRLTHWLLVVLLAFSWWSAEAREMEYHRYSGYALLGVLVFRLFWGLFGSSTARFACFVKGPRAIWRYVSASSPAPSAGHNPLGALSVLLILSLLLGQAVLGLFAVDVDGLESGPLSHWVSFEAGRQCAAAHAVVFNILLAALALHVIAVLFYLIVKRDNLILPMIFGWKTWRQDSPPQVAFAPWWRAVLGVALAAAALVVVV